MGKAESGSAKNATTGEKDSMLIPNTKSNLTDTQRELLIWFYNNQQWQHIDQGNMMEAYVEITGDEDFPITDFLMDIQALVMAKYLRTHTLDTFYYITIEGKEFVNNSTNPISIYQCCQCGDFYSLENIDPMILEAYIEQYPNGTVIEDTCSACEDENYRESRFWDDPDHEHDTWDDVLVYGEDPQ